MIMHAQGKRWLARRKKIKKNKMMKNEDGPLKQELVHRKLLILPMNVQ